MPVSTKLQLTISKTKKRLSSDHWRTAVPVLLLVGCLAIYTFAVFAATLVPDHGVVYGHIPVMPAAINDKLVNDQGILARHALTKETPLILLTTEAFYFGDLEAFTSEFSNVRNKFRIPHDDGQPQVGNLIETLEKWRPALAQGDTDAVRTPVVFLPSAAIPLPIVIKVMDGLRHGYGYSHIVLASGLH